jgi:hypothetical protein
MTGRDLRFDDLVGDELDPAERERLLAVHELLVQAGPPPELSPELALAPPVASGTVVALPRRYRFTAIAAAAAVAVVLFGAGYLIGGTNGGGATVLRTGEMTGAGGATASLAVLAKDDAGNWPMELTVRGLPPLARGQSYELWLTRNGELAESCGSFVVAATETVVSLNAPYRLSDYTGWVVTTNVDTGAFVLRTDET